MVFGLLHIREFLRGADRYFSEQFRIQLFFHYTGLLGALNSESLYRYFYFLIRTTSIIVLLLHFLIEGNILVLRSHCIKKVKALLGNVPPILLLISCEI